MNHEGTKGTKKMPVAWANLLEANVNVRSVFALPWLMYAAAVVWVVSLSYLRGRRSTSTEASWLLLWAIPIGGIVLVVLAMMLAGAAVP